MKIFEHTQQFNLLFLELNLKIVAILFFAAALLFCHRFIFPHRFIFSSPLHLFIFFCRFIFLSPLQYFCCLLNRRGTIKRRRRKKRRQKNMQRLGMAILGFRNFHLLRPDYNENMRKKLDEGDTSCGIFADLTRHLILLNMTYFYRSLNITFYFV